MDKLKWLARGNKDVQPPRQMYRVWQRRTSPKQMSRLHSLCKAADLSSEARLTYTLTCEALHHSRGKLRNE